MTTHRLFRNLCQLVVFSIMLVPLGLPRSAAPSAQAHPFQQVHLATTLPALNEVEPNDAITPANQANSIGPGSTTTVWGQTITGRISTESDIDWYSFKLTTPASNVSIALTNLPADYDLVLASGPISDTVAADDGLDNVATVGGRLSSIGGRLSSIGGSLSSIGGRLSSIGGSLSSIGGSLSSISVQRGTSAESIDTYLWQPGTYYLAVAGYNGAFSDQPYTLQVNVDSSAWQSLEASVPPAPDVALNLGNLSSVNTLYLMSASRMEQRYVESDFTVNQIKSALQSLASAANGYVLDLDALNQNGAASLVHSTDTITTIYDLADADPSNPLQANRIAKLIDNVITAATVRNPSGASGGQAPPPMPNLQHIVLVGGDSVIPFYRVPDLTSVSNEGTYADYLREIDSSGLIDPSSPLGGALHYRMILTDDLYGSDGAYRFPGAPLYLPKRAVGRLVESPDEILSYLQAYQAGPRLIDATNGRAVVTGYDFLTDQAQAVSQVLATEGLTPTGLISDTWTKSDLEQTWFNGQLTSLNQEPYYSNVPPSPFQLQSINAHFDHWQTIPATGTGTLYAQDILNPTDYPGDSQQPYFFNRLCYSVGCHSGLNVDDSSILESPTTPIVSLYQADFPQAFNKQAGNWIGNTGYGYGTDQIAYSERLSLLLTEALGERVLGARGVYVGQAIGTALVEAKQRYARRAAHLDAYDAKVLMETTLYGLPFVPAKVKNPQAPPAEETNINRVPTVEAPKVTNAGVLERVITFTNQFDQGTVARTGSSYPILRNVQVQDSFAQAGFPTTTPTLLTGAAAGLPTLPQFTYNLTGLGPLGSGERLKVKGVEFMGGVYDTLANYNPQISQVITQDLDLLPRGTEPPFDAGNGVWYPEKFYDVSNVDAGNSDIDQLLVTAAQFKAAAGGTTGSMRPYRSMVLKVIYIDPAAPGAAASLNDDSPPIIDSVRVTPAFTAQGIQSTSTRITVAAHDDSPGGVELVDNVYTNDQDNWVPVNFTQVDATHWTATIPVPPTDAHFIISAQDTAGNIGTFSAKGEYAVTAGPADPVKVYLPVVLR